MSLATAPARLLVAGDTHGNAWWINQLAELAYAFGCDGVLQLGDYGFWPHETWGDVFMAKVDASQLASDNEGDGRSWGLLQLPALTFLGGGEASPMAGVEPREER